MSTRLNFLVTHFLSSTTDVELSPRLGFVLADLKQQGGQLFRDAEPTALQRWSSKIGALIASPQSRTSGFKLAAISLELAPALWTTGAAGGVGTTNSASAKAWFDQAFKLAQKADTLRSCTPATAAALLDFLNLIFHKLPLHSEFAKQAIGSNTATKLADGLLDFCKDSAAAQASSNAYNLLVTLLQTHGAALKSLGPKFQDTVMAEIEHPGAQQVLAHLSNCHGRAEAGRQWKTLAEQIACHIRYYALPPVTTTLTSRTQSSLPKILNNFNSLPMPAVTRSDGQFLQPSDFSQATRHMDRFNALTNTLHLMLSSPTERSMLCPTSALLGLAIYLLSLMPTEQTSKRDEAVRNFEMTLLSQMHLAGARLAIQLVAGLGANVAEHDHEVLSALWQAAQVYPAHSRNRASILAAYTVYISRSLVNFDETTLEPVTTALLIDLAALKKTALIAPALSPAKTAPTAGQKAKSKQRLDDGLELNDTRPLNIDANVVDAAELACEGLATVVQLPQFSDDHFVLAARVIFQLCLDPDFALACTGPNLSASIPHNSQRLIHVLDFRPELREGLLEFLLALTTSPKSHRLPSLLNSAAGIFAQAALSSEEPVATLGKQGLHALQYVLHPIVPPLPVKAALLGIESTVLPEASTSSSNGASAPMEMDEAAAAAPTSVEPLSRDGPPGAIEEDEEDIVASSPAPEVPAAVDTAPSASALATDFQDSISGPVPVPIDAPIDEDDDAEETSIEPVKEGSPSSSSSHPKSVPKTRRRRHSGDVSADNILTSGQKRARTSLSGDAAKSKSKAGPSPPAKTENTGSLVVRPRASQISLGKASQVSEKEAASPRQSKTEVEPSRRKTSQSMKGKTSTAPKSASPAEEADTGSLRVLSYNKSGDKSGKSDAQPTSSKRSSGSPSTTTTSGQSVLTADASELPAPSAGDFFKDSTRDASAETQRNQASGAAGTTSVPGVDDIDPALMDEDAAPAPLKQPSEPAPAVPEAAHESDSDDDGPMPKIVDSEDDADGEEDNEDLEMQT